MVSQTGTTNFCTLEELEAVLKGDKKNKALELLMKHMARKVIERNEACEPQDDDTPVISAASFGDDEDGESDAGSNKHAGLFWSYPVWARIKNKNDQETVPGDDCFLQRALTACDEHEQDVLSTALRIRAQLLSSPAPLNHDQAREAGRQTLAAALMKMWEAWAVQNREEAKHNHVWEKAKVDEVFSQMEKWNWVKLERTKAITAGPSTILPAAEARVPIPTTILPAVRIITPPAAKPTSYASVARVAVPKGPFLPPHLRKGAAGASNIKPVAEAKVPSAQTITLPPSKPTPYVSGANVAAPKMPVLPLHSEAKAQPTNSSVTPAPPATPQPPRPVIARNDAQRERMIEELCPYNLVNFNRVRDGHPFEPYTKHEIETDIVHLCKPWWFAHKDGKSVDCGGEWVKHWDTNANAS
ncbi:hypothetical protein LTR97_002373 [Elasticomyces elasticus]|uniref:Uncharacterized protein n=1 Tax=Elasticomyces elasticus TaxID=574655 RepID=A0AAN7WAK8_9PEZI|nr:hypothetical protein LTR97_002373 [Elasticomyces elasticus]